MRSSQIMQLAAICIWPPFATFLVSGCGAALFINFWLSILGLLPGHIVGLRSR
ncbi:hypothetical protein R3P38DRAFT_3063541 [Favolaschia claudopus]|uniref:YqaE/Pmp3 family membrane protein n=1 Tax=Favolaschia claudopus TaxID=2862362 RepID=A0AAW0A1C8_9AGAR